MAKVMNSAAVVLTTSESDIIAPTDKSLTLLIQIVNATATARTCEIWTTDANNVHKACILPYKEIEAYDGISDVAKHIIPAGYKIRGVASAGSAIYVEVSYVEGV